MLTALFSVLVHGYDLNSRFSKARFTVGTRKIQAHVADTDPLRQRGLMEVEKMGPDEGMLFVFPAPQFMNFWMKDTRLPLAIGFFDRNCVLLETLEMEVPRSVFDRPPTYQSQGEAVFSLEMNHGWFKAHGVKPGAKIRLDGPTASDLLRRQLARCR